MRKYLLILALFIGLAVAACQGSRLIAPVNEANPPAPEAVPAPPPDNCPGGT